MALARIVDILRSGVAAWNAFREAAPGEDIDLSAVDLSSRDLPFGATADDPYDGYLGNINLRGTNLSRSRLSGLCVKDADFCGANLEYAILSGSTFIRVNFSGANLRGADLRSMRAVDSNFDGADLEEARVGEASIEVGIPDR